MIRTGDLKISVFEFIVMIIVLYNQIMYIPQSSKYKSVVVELSASLSFMIFCNGVLSCINGTEFFGSYYINYVFTVIYFILNGLVPLLWFKYMYIFYDTSPKKSNSYITTIPYLLYLLLIFINCFTDLFFYIDSNNRYQRGDGFWLIVVLSVIYIIASVVVIVLAITRNRGFRSEGKHILSGMLLVALGIILQLYFWEDSFVLLTFLLFMLIVFLRFQNLEMLVDPLTGLGNRRRMQLYIDKLSRKRKGEFSAIVFDIDDFKAFNDTYGHSFGDEVLRTVGKLLSRKFPNAVVGRFGGDEFIVFARGTSESAVVDDFEDFLEVSGKAEIGGKRYTIKCSVGIAWSESCDVDYAQYFDEADEQLYRAKKEGKHRICRKKIV